MFLDSFEHGKQLHMSSAAEQLSTENRAKVTRNNTLLIDDDSNNIRMALRGEIRAIWFDINAPDKIIQDLKDLIATEEVSPSGGGTGNLLLSPMKVYHV